MGSKVVVSFAVVFMLFVGLSSAKFEIQSRKPKVEASKPLACALPQALITEIASYSWLAQLLIDHLITPGGSLKGLTYNYVADFTDRFGPRHTGEQTLEDSIDYLVTFLATLNFANVHTETVTVPVWQRGNEQLELLQPRYKKLALLGLGTSIGTPPEGITADIIVVQSFDELDQRSAEAYGKIVVFNQPFVTYTDTKVYRVYGASAASKYGAVAALIRSLTTLSIYSPHTGDMEYNTTYAPVKIPSASITVEDAEMLQRMVNRGYTVQLKLYMEAQNLPDSTSRNTVGDILGSSLPNEYVVTSGHIDSWDVGEGVMDDAAGTFVGVLSAYVLKTLGVATKRTLRAIAWTAEEQKLAGSTQYAQQHAADLINYDFVTESNGGTFTPTGYSFTGNNDATCIIQEILKLAIPMNTTQFRTPDVATDTEPFSASGVPTGSTLNDYSTYMYYHHSNGDTLTVEDSDDLDRCVALTALVTGVVADLSVSLPRG